jgi:uncharacterized repeat protein (TIGR01451 family)
MKTSVPTLVLAALLAGAAGLRPVHAQTVDPDHTAASHYVGFDDINGNGRLDCGEPVTLKTGYFTANGTTTGLSGTLVAPSTGSAGISFLPGSAYVTPDENVSCDVQILSGDGPEDTFVQASFRCDPSISNPVGQSGFTITYKAVYGNPSFAAFSSSTTVHTPDLGDISKSETQTVPASACPGVANSLRITKTEAGTAVPGATITYTLTAQNLGPLGAGGIQLVDTVPPNTTFVPAASDPGWFCSPGNGPGAVCTNAVGNVLAGASVSRLFAVAVANPLPAGVSMIPNTGCVREGPSQVDDCKTISTPTAGTPVLSVAKTLLSGTAVPGGTLVYKISATNTGNAGATAVSLSEAIPANTTFDGAASDPGWSCSASTCTASLAALNAGATSFRRFAVSVANPLPAGTTGIANQACATSPDASSDCHTVTTPTTGRPMLNLTKSLSSGTPTPGATLVYALAVQNTGNQGAAGVAFQETVPAHTTFVPGSSTPGWACSPGPTAGATCTLAVGTLAAGAGASALFAIAVENPLAAGTTLLSNTGCAVDDTSDRSCATLPIIPNAAPVLRLVKTYSGGPIQAGGLLVYSLTVSNAGNENDAGVVLTDTIPANTSFDAVGSSPGWSCAPDGSAGSVCTLAVGALDAGQTAARLIALRVADPLPAGISQVANTACTSDAPLAVEISKRPLSRVLNACAQTTTPTAAAIDSSLADALAVDVNGDGMAEAGDTIAYTFVVTNISGVPATGLVVKPDLDPNLSLVPGSVVASGASVVLGNGPNDHTVEVDLASLAPGAQMTVTFQATVAANLPPGTTHVQSQVFTAGSNFATDASDDPSTVTDDDPTVTPLGQPKRPIATVPTLSAWGLLLLALGLSTAALPRLRV